MDIEEALERIFRRLEALDQKVEALVSPPRAFKPLDAAKLLGVGRTTMRSMIAGHRIRTVPIEGREHIPISEIFRLTSVPTGKRTRAAPNPRPRGLTEGDKTRARLKARRKR